MAAKKGTGPVAGSDRGKVIVRFMDVEIEGSNETVLEGIRHIAQATSTPRTVVRYVNAPTVSAKVLPAKGDDGGAPEQAEEDSAEDEEPEVEEERATHPPVAPKKPRAARTAPDLVDVNFDGDPMPFPEFLATTTVTKDSSEADQVIVIATWLRDHRQMPDIGTGELYTVCKLADWDPPTDLTSPMRNLKRANDNRMKSTARGRFELTLVGDKHFKTLRKQ